jgi:hypothetical protein
VSEAVHHAFFDASVYLDLYAFPPEDLDQVNKLAALVEAGSLVIYLPSQVEDEFRRRRSGVIAELLKPLRDARVGVATPAMARGRREPSELRQHATAAEKARSELLNALVSSARAKTLPADVLLHSLFGHARRLPCDSCFDAASTRRALGNPPGKKTSLGDAVNWEALLASVDKDCDLCLVSSDGDFASPLDPEALDEYLAEEWANLKNSKVRFYRDFPRFLETEYPGIHLVTDIWKHLLIQALGRSGSFDRTHDLVHRLARHREFTTAEAELLLTIALQNQQVRWIARDADVQDLLDRVVRTHGQSLSPVLVGKWQFILGGKAPAYGPEPTDEEISGTESPGGGD